MHRRNRHTLLCAALASSVALGGAAALAAPASAAPTAVPAASCTVTPDPSGNFVVITGEGFTAPRNLNDGETTEPLNIDANGNFRVQRFQKNVDYTVLAVHEDQNFVFVNCQVKQPTSPTSPSTTAPSHSREYKHGYADGFTAGVKAASRSDCTVPPQPDKSRDHSKSYWEGWKAGAEASYDQRCDTGSDGGPAGQ
ncbi:hypothetical protein QEZ40_005480 [Streptomyces katrae]|uniref:Secreted protein n=1 Tax=Streptomyces katrae TaxID=68223 RepID=A0ABT7H1U0_9ACTN|nr:hypothetical protein [Streptomyces katrae]MDK9499862.1 hypothetical protein [Streptomyces katrae]